MAGLYITTENLDGRHTVYVSSVNPDAGDYDDWQSNRFAVGASHDNETKASIAMNIANNVLRNGGATVISC